MKTSAEIIAHLRDLRSASLVRPHMFASSPEALEDVLSLIDRLFQFLEPPAGPAQGYGEFLLAKGYDSASFCSRQRPRTLSQEDRALFEELAEFWQEYLESRFALP